jgi:hypothetical protein
MKIFVVLMLTAVFFDCSSKKSTPANTMENFLSYSNKEGEIDYSFNAKLVKKGLHNGITYQNDVVQIEYNLTNTGDKNYLVYNAGHSGTNDATVYVEPQTDGTVEISQKAFAEPKDKNCPDRFMAIMPKASWLKANQTVKKQFELALPLQTKTPFDDCLPVNVMPKEISKVNFCIGVSEADANKVTLDKDGNIKNPDSAKPQKLLCSTAVALK